MDGVHLGLTLRERWNAIPPERKRLLAWFAGGAALVAIVSMNLGRIARGAQLLLTADTLRRAMPGLKPARLVQVLPHLQDALEEASINTPMRIAAFLAQTGMESGDFAAMEEYASGAAYEGRTDLGNTQPGDGVRFKGRGPIQLTGRNNYTAFSQAMGKGDLFVQQPELVKTDAWGFKAAAWFWNMRGLNKYADAGAFNAVTYRINGGCMGYWERDRRYKVAKEALGIADAPVVAQFTAYRNEGGKFVGYPAVCCTSTTADGKKVGRPGAPGCPGSTPVA